MSEDRSYLCKKHFDLPKIASVGKRVRTQDFENNRLLNRESTFIRNMKKAHSIMITCKFQKKRKNMLDSCISRSFRTKQNQRASQLSKIIEKISKQDQNFSKKKSSKKMITQHDRYQESDSYMQSNPNRSKKSSPQTFKNHFFPISPIRQKKMRSKNKSYEKQKMYTQNCQYNDQKRQESQYSTKCYHQGKIALASNKVQFNDFYIKHKEQHIKKIIPSQKPKLPDISTHSYDNYRIKFKNVGKNVKQYREPEFFNDICQWENDVNIIEDSQLVL